MSHHLKLHARKVVALALVTLFASALMATRGALIETGALNWTDIIGEGGGALMVLTWFLLVLMGRPKGHVTNLLAWGLGSLFIGMWVDALDEFFKLPAAIGWRSMIESVPMLMGWIVTTFGIYAWHREQLGISRQLRTREGDVRDHRHFDALTPVSRVAYFAAQSEQLRQKGAPASIINLDLMAFRQLNLDHGADACDHVLQTLAQVLALNLRDGDLVCRKAGDQFSILLPATSLASARQIADELRKAVEATCFRDAEGIRMNVRARATATDLALSSQPHAPTQTSPA